MSRGLGFWQRTILAAVAQAENSFYLAAVLPHGYTHAQYNAAHRAALKLADDGRIGMRRYLCGGGPGGGHKVVIGRPGAALQRPDRPIGERLS